MKDFKEVIILMLIALSAGICLSVVYTATKDRIEEVKRQQRREAFQEVLPFINQLPDDMHITFEDKQNRVSVYAIDRDGDLLGAALEISTKAGYGGDMTFLVGVDPSGKVKGFSLLEQKETPGLGTKAEKKKFWGQFLDKTTETFDFKVQKDGGDVMAITAATITSRAVSEGVERGLLTYKNYLNQRGDQ
ncbi:RnfABCDGE type electron transport complex subunit G [bacterium]|nr:RnfABCDGE type electron transport complex subunit G [candidate division CSSED10-310 bacterium]